MRNLVITGLPGESFIIDEQITVTILPSTGKEVRISIDAPRRVSIRRSELAMPGDTRPMPELPQAKTKPIANN
jgi:carbon storage regulator CsrA